METPERRKAERFHCAVPVMCRRGTAFDNSQTKDISEHGIGLISQRFIPRNSKLLLEIALKPASEPILVVGKVRWVEKMGYSEMYRLGMEFEDLSEGSGSRLSKYLEDSI